MFGFCMLPKYKHGMASMDLLCEKRIVTSMTTANVGTKNLPSKFIKIIMFKYLCVCSGILNIHFSCDLNYSLDFGYKIRQEKRNRKYNFSFLAVDGN